MFYLCGQNDSRNEGEMILLGKLAINRPRGPLKAKQHESIFHALSEMGHGHLVSLVSRGCGCPSVPPWHFGASFWSVPTSSLAGNSGVASPKLGGQAIWGQSVGR